MIERAGGARRARRCMSPAQDWTSTEERGRLVYQDEDGLLDLPPPKLLGRHQFDNAGTAIAALRARGAASSRDRRIEAGPARAPNGRRACSG